MKWLLLCVTVALWCHYGGTVNSKRTSLGLLRNQQRHSTVVTMDKAKLMFKRERRAAPNQADSPGPIIHGNYSFMNDRNHYAIIEYLGSKSPVIFVLTFSDSDSNQPINSTLYRSSDYGANFSPILDQLDHEEASPALWANIFISKLDHSLIIIQHATKGRFYYSRDDGVSWSVQVLSPTTIDPTSLRWNPADDRMALAHDSQNDQLYVTHDLGRSWSKIADYVASPTDYQWGDPAYDADASMVYFNTYDPSVPNRGDFTVSLFTQRVPFSSNTMQEFDPGLGRHDDFVLLGPYIFAQKTDSQGMISLYVSYKRQSFQRAMIPSTDPHQNYIVSHIDELQAMVIVEHTSGQFNLYLSDETGVYFSLSLPDIVVEQDSGIDLELIEGVNGTLVANQYVRNRPSEPRNQMRTLISLDNGGNWELVRSSADSNCVPPQCSLHFHMTTSEYARTGVYSQASAPGLILAHGNTGTTLSRNPDLYISRDGGVSWSRTLQSSWGVTVVDHGGLLVAARDYHQTRSTVLKYSCNEGLSWTDFAFTTANMVIFGVVTEPGEHTTTVSLYGQKNGRTWDVITVNFSSIFPSSCSGSDYYYWRPWDYRTEEGCILGSSVTIERRNASICCFIGEDYTRPVRFSVCPCIQEDFVCDYGYQHSDGFTGACIRDESISIQDACSQGQGTAMASRGYRKAAGDVCSGGSEEQYSPVQVACNAGNKTVVIVLGALLAVAVCVAILFGALAILPFCKARSRPMVGGTSRVQFRNDSPSSQPLTSGTDDDDDPLAL